MNGQKNDMYPTHIYTHVYTESLKKEILPFVTAWMNLENIMPSEVSQSQDTYRMIPLIWAI